MKDVGRIVMAECQIGQPEGDIVERRRKRVGVLDRAEMKVELFPLVLFYFFTHLFLPIAPPSLSKLFKTSSACPSTRAPDPSTLCFCSFLLLTLKR